MHANASPLARAKHQHRPLHLRQLRLVVRGEPTLGTEGFGVVSEDILVVLDDGGVDADLDACGEERTGELRPAGGDVARHAGAEGWVQAHALFDAGAEVGQFDGVAVLYVRR